MSLYAYLLTVIKYEFTWININVVNRDFQNDFVRSIRDSATWFLKQILPQDMVFIAL